MFKKIFTLTIALTFMFNAIGNSFADTKKSKNKYNELAVLLPDSDGVMTFDVNRMINQALPQILSSNPSMLLKINGEIDNIKNKTGFDLRQFNQIAIGIKNKQISAKEIEFEPITLARGNVDADSLVAVAKLVSDGKYKTEQISNRTVYIFSPKEIIEKNKPKDTNSILDKGLDKILKSLSKEVAITAYDSNTVAFGTVERVKETLGKTPRIKPKVLDFLNRTPGAVANFGMMLPGGMSQFLELEDDELGKNLDAVRQIQGAFDVDSENMILSLAAKTLQNEQAEGLEGMFLGFRMIFGPMLKSQKGADKKVYGNMLENLQVRRIKNEVTLDLKVPQSDLDVIIGKK